jgi:site-specific recombinase XerD
LPPITSVLALVYTPILAQAAWVFQGLLRNLCDKWVKRQEDRNAGGNLSTTLYRSHRFVFSTYVPNYADFKKWKLIKDIPYDGWNEYRKWRMEEGWKLIGLDEKGNERKYGNKLRHQPKDSTVNREVTMIQEWYKYLLIPEKLMMASPTIEKAKQRKNQHNANPPFSRDDYRKIYTRFRSWSNEKNLTKSQKPEWRKVVYLFFLLSANVGWRPDSEGLELTWENVKIRKRTTKLPNGENKDEWIANLKIWDRKNSREREGNFLGGEYFRRLKDLYIEWNAKNPDFYIPNRKSLIFADPATGKKLSYTSIIYAYKKVLDSLGLKDTYTFYSCRSFYVNERLKEGVEVFTVAKQTGHSMQICNQYYARLDIQSRADEATRRTYGKQKADEGELLF